MDGINVECLLTECVFVLFTYLAAVRRDPKSALRILFIIIISSFLFYSPSLYMEQRTK